MNYLRNFLKDIEQDIELKNHWNNKGYVIIRNAVADLKQALNSRHI